MESRCFASLIFPLESTIAPLTSKGPRSHDIISNTVSVKGLWYVPYEAALKQIRLFTLTRTLGDLISMFKLTHGLLEFPMASTFAYQIRKGIRGHAYKYHQQRFCTHRRQSAFTIRAFGLILEQIVNTSSMKSFKTLLFPKYPSNPPPPTTHSLSTHRPK